VKQKAYEMNLDGLVGPTHNYAGLSYGNLAAAKHALMVSNPRAAVEQGLKKMKLLSDLGVVQVVLPPHERPNIRVLRRLGFRGSDKQALAAANDYSGALSAACYSSSAMWAANSATVSPSLDAGDGKIHFTPANLITLFHRSIETEFTGLLLETIFNDPQVFAHHKPLPGSLPFSDEGAANHTRLCRRHDEPGIEIFVYSRESFSPSSKTPLVFPARQSLEASQAIARLHRLDPKRVMFIKQNPEAVDAGVFHNDVISVGNENLFFYHSQAFENCEAIGATALKFAELCGEELFLVPVNPDRLSIKEAVDTYLFNSQVVTLKDGHMAVIAPQECLENAKTRVLLQEIVEGANPVKEVHYIDIRQSMRNGGGPACLRLRVVVTEAELARVNPNLILNAGLYADLMEWGGQFYRDRLSYEDLLDPQLIIESRTALDRLTQILHLGPIYPFQQE
jgi:succinylarginine dihydrolase